jgi:hypothetical protein
MTTHYHLLVETPHANLAAGMQRINGQYGQTFNWHHARRGHVFEGRYSSTLVQRQSHLLEVARYIVLNPVRGGLCQAPEGWPWSSYLATAGERAAPPFLVTDWILGLFDSALTAARARYRAFVAEGLANAAMPELHLAGV